MSKLAKAKVRIRQYKDKQQDKKLRKLELKTNKALRDAKRNEAFIKAQRKAAKAQASASATKRQKNAERIKKNEQRMKGIKKFGKKFLKGLAR